MKRKSSLQRAINLKRLDEMSSKGGLTAMALARTLPYFPPGILTALGAVSRMSARDYIIANLIGKFPSTALEVVVGHDVVQFPGPYGPPCRLDYPCYHRLWGTSVPPETEGEEIVLGCYRFVSDPF